MKTSSHPITQSLRPAKRTLLAIAQTAALATALLVLSSPAMAGLLGYWTFDDDSLNDRSGKGYHAAQPGSAGSPGGAANPVLFSTDLPPIPLREGATAAKSLDCTGDRAAFVSTGGSETVFNFAGNRFAISWWFKTWPSADWAPFVAKGGETFGGANQGWQARRHGGSNDLNFTTRGIGLSSGDFASDNAQPGVKATIWQHAAMVYDGTWKHIYINGVHARSEAAANQSLVATTAKLTFGARHDPSTNTWQAGTFSNCRIDDVAIFDHALVAAEVADLYAGADPRKGLRTSSRPFDLGWAATDATLPQGGPGYLGVREIRPNGQVLPGTSNSNVFAVTDAVLYARKFPPAGGTAVIATRDGSNAPQLNSIDFQDPQAGSVGLNGSAQDFLTNTAGDDDHFLQVAQGCFKVNVPGKYSFYLRGDDGMSFSIMGRNWEKIVLNNGAGSISGDTVQNGAPTGDTNTLAVIDLPAGSYNWRYVWNEQGSGAWNEVLYAPGDKSGYDSTFRQLGDATGGLELVVHVPLADFNASVSHVSGGSPANITLFWSVAYALNVRLNGGAFSNQNVTANTLRGLGSITTPAPATTTTYTLIAARGLVSETRTVTVYVDAPPVIFSFTADDTTLTAGSPITFRWNVGGHNTVTINDGTTTTNVAANTDITGSGVITTLTAPSSTTTYTLTVSNAFGSATAQVTIQRVFPATITNQPGNQTVCAGQTATFNVVVGGTPDWTFQWKKNGTSIPGSNSPFYTTPATSASDNGALFSVIVTNSGGSVTSNNATLTVNTPPSITTQPSSQITNFGLTATFSVTAAGTAPLSYQWRKNGTNISGATSASYTTPPATGADNGALFSVVVTNGCGSVTSNNAALRTPPVVATHPANQTVCAPDTATFSVTATGTGTLSYQWRKNGTNIPGATSASYTTPATVASDNGALFTVLVSDSIGSSTTFPGTLTVNTPPSITTQPANQTVNTGQTATFSVTAAGTAPVSYQWKKNGTNIVAATSASYTTPATVASDNGALFAVTVTNSCGSVTSNNATLTVIIPPSITTQPGNQTACAGDTATFSVAATGTAPLSYQWKKNGTNIAGATGASYTTPANSAIDSGAVFAVTVTNSGGSATSNNASLTVSTPPSITTQPANQTVNTGQTATFSVTAAGAAPLSYQWKKNGSNLAGATNASHTTPATIASDNGAIFTVTITNSCGSIASDAATLTLPDQCVPPPAGLVLWLPLDELTGTTTANLYSAGNNGTLVNSPVATTGYVRNSLSFDGASRSVDVPDYAAINPGAGDLSIDAWVKRNPTSGTTTRIIVDKRSSSVGPGYSLAVSFGNLIFSQGDPTGQTNHRDTSTVPADDQWHFVAVTVNRASATGGRFYIDGTPTGTFDPTIRPGSLNNANSFQIGRSAWGGNSPWVGGLDEVEMFNRALSANEVAAIYNARSAGKCRSPVILTQLQNQTAVIGSAVTFSVTVAGAPPLSYQWRKDGVARSGATGPIFTISNAQINDAGTYDVVVSNSDGSVTSAPAMLIMAPKATMHLDDARHLVGSACCWEFDLRQSNGAPGNIAYINAVVTTLGVSVTSVSGPAPGPGSQQPVLLTANSMRWYMPAPNGLWGAMQTVTACFDNIPASGATIVFRGYDAQGNTSSGSDLLFLEQTTIIGANGECACPPPTVNSATICAGGSATLTATTNASSPSYLWSPGGATSASITVSPGLTTIYTVMVTDGVTGCSASGSGTVTVSPLLIDLFVEDTPTTNTGGVDTGLEPEPNMVGKDMWLSRGIWVHSNPNLPAGDYQTHANPEFGQANRVFVKVCNRACATDSRANVTLYYAAASTGLTWPASWTLIGDAPVLPLASGECFVTSVLWQPPGPGHYCLLARIISADDPMTVVETGDVNSNTRNNNNIAWRNVNVVDRLPHPFGKFTANVKNIAATAKPLKLMLTADQNYFVTGGEAYVDLGPLFTRWQGAGLQGLNVAPVGGTLIRLTGSPAVIENVPFAANEEQTIHFITGAAQPMSVPGTSHVYNLDLVQLVDGVRVGGISYAATMRAQDTDTDGDGIKDVADLDDDNDGLPDDWEFSHGLNPTGPSDAMLDADGDGSTNLAEYQAGTDPQNLRSTRVETLGFDAQGAFLLRFEVVPNRAYTLEATPTLGSPWSPIYEVTALPFSRIVELAVPVSGQPARFFRLRIP